MPNIYLREFSALEQSTQTEFIKLFAAKFSHTEFSSTLSVRGHERWTSESLGKRVGRAAKSVQAVDQICGQTLIDSLSFPLPDRSLFF